MATAVSSEVTDPESLSKSLAKSSIADSKLESVNGPRTTPFAHPAPSSKAPANLPLTEEQTTKYHSLLNVVSSWTTVPTSPAAKAPYVAITEAEQMWLTRECLLRYLRASRWVVATAQSRLLATLGWRREYNLAKLTAEYMSEENETGKQCIVGYDNDQRPCHILNPSKQNTPKSDRQVEHLVFMLERDIDLMPPGQETLALLINYADATSGQGATIAQARLTMHILQHHYPERLGRAFLMNSEPTAGARSGMSIAKILAVPWFFWAFYKIVSTLIDPITKEKLVFNEKMTLHVPAEQLLQAYGGDVAFEYRHDVYWPALNGLAHERRQQQHERWVKGGKMVGELERYLRGGQEESLKDTMVQPSSEMTRKSGGDKETKMVNFSDDRKPGETNAVGVDAVPEQKTMADATEMKHEDLPIEPPTATTRT